MSAARHQQLLQPGWQAGFGGQQASVPCVPCPNGVLSLSARLPLLHCHRTGAASPWHSVAGALAHAP